MTKKDQEQIKGFKTPEKHESQNTVIIIKRENGRNKVTLNCPKGSSLTKQQFKDEVDVKNIVKKFLKTGEVPNIQTRTPPRFGDFTTIPTDYQIVANTIIEAQNAFDKLPLKVRQKLKTPEAYLEFLSNPKNIDEAIELGLAKRKEPTQGGPITAPPGPEIDYKAKYDDLQAKTAQLLGLDKTDTKK